MSKDVKISTDAIDFKYRVNGIVIIDDKILTVQMNDNGRYCLPGGHVELGEDTKHAVLREMEEEIGYPVKIVKLLSIAENFFYKNNGKKVHEISFYYIVEPVDIKQVNLSDHIIIEHGPERDMKMDFKWATTAELKTMGFNPVFIGDKLASKNYEFEHHINNEIIN